MTTPTLPRDKNAEPIQVLQPVPSATVSVASGASTASVQLPSGYTIFQFHGTEDAWIDIGDSTVTAASGELLLPADMPVVYSVGENTHVAAIQGPSATAGNVYITPMK